MKDRMFAGAALLVVILVSLSAGAVDSTWIEHMSQGLEKGLNQAGADGQLTAAEAKGKMPLVSRHFAEIDADKNNTVTRDEIQQYASSKKTGAVH